MTALMNDGYRNSQRTGPREELHHEGQLIALFSTPSDWPLRENDRITVVRQCSLVVAPARLVVDEDVARFFLIRSVRLGYESLLYAEDDLGCQATMFPPLPTIQADVRAPWRNLAHKIGTPGMQFAIEVQCLWNIAPDSPPFRAAIFGRLCT